MSFTPAERALTREQLLANLAISGLGVDVIAADLGYTPARLQAAVDMTDQADTVDVWEVRDYLAQAVVDAGGEPAQYTILTEASRVDAERWFTLRKAPRHAF